MLSRRRFVLASMAGIGCCQRKPSGYPGYGIVANQGGGAVGVVDLERFTLAKHIRLEGNPSHVVGNPAAGRVYALTPDSGTIHEIRTDSLTLARNVQVAKSAVAMRLAPDGKTLAVASDDPKSFTLGATGAMDKVSATPLPARPVHPRL